MSGAGGEAVTSKRGNRWKLITIALGILATIFFVVMLVYIVKYHKLLNERSEGSEGGVSSDEMKQVPPTKAALKSNKIYSEFTPEQYNAVIKYIIEETSLGVVPSSGANLSSNYIYSVDPILPDKSRVVEYLDNNNVDMPMVKARVTLFMGASKPKTIKEVIVYPVDAPTSMEDFVYPRGNPPTWQSRPICNLVEAKAIDDFLLQAMKPLTPLLKSQLNMWYDETCGNRCLFYAPVPRVTPGDTNRTVFIFFHFNDKLQDYYLWPAPMKFLIFTPDNGDEYMVVKITYDNIAYSTVQELVDAYNNGEIAERTPGVEEKFKGRYGSQERRGDDFNPDDLPPPSISSPAKRYVVNERHVSWLGWDFDFAFRTISSVQFFNVKFNNERIAYQLGLQDIAVHYTGTDIDKAFRMYMDVGWSIGARTSALRRGYDCPESAEYITGSVYDVGFDRPIKLKDAACVFEYRKHVPLRRHYSVDFFDYESFRFTMSMKDVVLVFRQILTVWNYDYIMDIEIHQSGVIQASVNPTGYVQVISTDKSAGIKYGYDILPEVGITALLHTHMFDFIVDLDIADANSNRFMTVDIETETKTNPYYGEERPHLVMKERTKATEKEAIVQYDFAKPKEYVIFNNNERNSRNNRTRGYRIQSSSFVNTLMPSDSLFNAASWVRHQIAVTKHKDNETSTLSFFSQGDPYNPPVALSYFQEDNESILDEDLVCWITLGVNHIPTAEDVPVTTTASKQMAFYLIPHNYFEEDPSLSSRDAQVQNPAV